MAWIKRNLFFAIGSLIAVALMGVGGYYLYQQITDESKVAEDISGQYEKLHQLSIQNPHPGGPPASPIDNIKNARAQETELKGYITKVHPLFERITPIPDSAAGKITDAEFAAQLRNTVTQLHRTAAAQSVLLSSNYYFTFEAQKSIMIFDPASLEPLSVHLGEIKALAEILFNAKVNSLDRIRREKISEKDDTIGEDYLIQKTSSAPLADMTPYEITFKCFSAELANVLASLASSPHGFVVKTINVEPTASEDTSGGNMMGTQPPPNQPTPNIPVNRRGGGMFQPPVIAPTAPIRPSGPTVFLNERPFRVILSVVVVKLKPAK
jgi:hypothetical protein